MRLRIYTLLLGTLSLAAPALADPWAEVGDRRLREDIELLADSGVIPGPTSVWPLPWAQISAGIDSADLGALTPSQQAALMRVRALMSAREEGVSYEVTTRFTNDPALVRDFSDRARGDFDLSGRTLFTSGRFFASLGVGVRDDAQARDVQIDQSYVALSLGNYALYAGYLDQWWGPSHEQSLLISNNARPFPKIGLSRMTSAPFESKLLRWIGPFRFDAFAGILNGPRREVFKNPALLGFRFTFEPIDGLEIGLSRLLQLCGSNGRPCSFNTFAKALFPFGSADNTGTLNEPGNQGAGYELRYHHKIGSMQAAYFLHTFAEDTLFEVLSVQAGASLTGTSTLGNWRVAVEALDTLGRTFSKQGFNKRQAASTFVNGIYTDGFGYRGRVISASLDGDSRLFTLSAALTDAKNRRWYAQARRADINVSNSTVYRVSQNRERLFLGEIGVDMPTRFGDLSLEARGQTDSPNSPGRKDAAAQVELRFKAYF